MWVRARGAWLAHDSCAPLAFCNAPAVVRICILIYLGGRCGFFFSLSRLLSDVKIALVAGNATVTFNRGLLKTIDSQGALII